MIAHTEVQVLNGYSDVNETLLNVDKHAEEEKIITFNNELDKFDRVYIHVEALENLKAHLKENSRVERGGILFGDVFDDRELGRRVDIVAALPTPAHLASGASLEYNPDLWGNVIANAREEHREGNIIGWYHSRPNRSIFISIAGTKIQENYFSDGRCVCVIYDPVSDNIGFFLGASLDKVTPIVYSSVPNIEEDVSDIDDIQIEEQPINPAPEALEQEEIQGKTDGELNKEEIKEEPIIEPTIEEEPGVVGEIDSINDGEAVGDNEQPEENVAVKVDRIGVKNEDRAIGFFGTALIIIALAVMVFQHS